MDKMVCECRLPVWRGWEVESPNDAPAWIALEGVERLVLKTTNVIPVRQGH